MKLTNFLGLALFAQQTFAHPGQSAEELAQEIAERRAYLAANKRSLAHCADSLKARGNHAAMHQRRAAQVEAARAKRSIDTGKVTSNLLSSICLYCRQPIPISRLATSTM